MDWSAIWNQIKEFFSTNSWRIVGFFSTLLLGILLIKLVLYALKKTLSKTRLEKITLQFALTAIKYVLWLALILSLISIVGIEISGIITTLSAVLLAIGMALENNIANVANGIVIIGSQMFKKGDYISVDGVEGSIIDINFLFTTLQTPDNKRITIPNSTIVNNSVVNSGANKTRRVDFTFSVAYESDVEKVKSVILSVMSANGKVYLDEGNAPFCRLKALNSSSIDFFAYCWCDSEDYWDVYYYVLETVYNEFKKNGISVPYNQLEIRARTDETVLPFDKSDLPPRVEKIREEEHQDEFERILDEAETRRMNRRKKRKAEKAKKAALEKAEREKQGQTKNAALKTDKKQ